jgi:hypothetical protein
MDKTLLVGQWCPGHCRMWQILGQPVMNQLWDLSAHQNVGSAQRKIAFLDVIPSGQALYLNMDKILFKTRSEPQGAVMRQPSR